MTMQISRHSLNTISAHQSYHGWPTVARLQSGELLVVSSSGRERHVCPFGQVHLIRSHGNGATWSAPEVLVNGPLDDRDAGIWQTARGTVLVNWFTSVAWLRRLEQVIAGDPHPKTVEFAKDDGFISRCQKVRALLTDDLIRRELGTWIIRSTDGGQTWSDKIDCGVGSPHGPTQLSDGRLLFVGNRKQTDLDIRTAGAAYAPTLCACESSDDGLTWRWLADIPQREGDPLGCYHEPHAVQAPDGRIIVHIRHHGERDKGFILQSESTDGGQSFTVPHNTGLAGLPAHLLRLRDGRLLTTYGYRIEPSGNRASVSEDGGRTWSEPMILDEKSIGRDLGYPSTVELEDDTLLSVWYERLPDDVMASLQAAHWSLPG